jgi:integrase
MKKRDANNERTKRAYFNWLRNAKGGSEASIDAAAAAINRFELHTHYRDFKGFHIEQATAFKRNLREQVNRTTGERLSASTLFATLSALRTFFKWLAGQPGYRSKISYSDADYFGADRMETAVAKAHREPRVPTLEQIRHVLKSLPAEGAIEKRNQALIAFTILTGARDTAIASMKLRHIDLMKGAFIRTLARSGPNLQRRFGRRSSQLARSLVKSWRRGSITFALSSCGVSTTRCFPRREWLSVRAGNSRPSGWQGSTGQRQRPFARCSESRSKRPGSLLQPPLISPRARSARSATLPDTGGVQGLVAEPRP